MNDTDYLCLHGSQTPEQREFLTFAVTYAQIAPAEALRRLVELMTPASIDAEPVTNPAYHAVYGEPECLAPDSGYVCTAQRGHDGPDHIAFGDLGRVSHRWPVAPAHSPDTGAWLDVAGAEPRYDVELVVTTVTAHFATIRRALDAARMASTPCQGVNRYSDAMNDLERALFNRTEGE